MEPKLLEIAREKQLERVALSVTRDEEARNGPAIVELEPNVGFTIVAYDAKKVITAWITGDHLDAKKADEALRAYAKTLGVADQ